MNITRYTLIPTLILILLSSSACSNNKKPPYKQAAKLNIAKTSIVDLNEIKPLEALSSRLAAHRVVLVGEIHTNYGDHLNQLAVIKSLHKHWKKKTSIGLEMIQQPYQSILDKYIAGEINERDMLLKTEWFDRWQFDFRLYRPIFNYARENKIPLVALNIPKELTKRITKVGIKGLTPTERKQLPEHIDRSNSNYTNRIKAVFSGHMRTSSKGFDNFLDAQLAWDEGMAYAAAKHLQKNPTQKMVILAGSGHIINREGIPDRLGRLIDTKPVVVLNQAHGVPSASQGDYLLFSPETKLPPIGLIGIHMKASKSNKGVIVAALSQHGAALKAGVKKGDIIIGLDKHPVYALVDIKLAVENKKPGDTVLLNIKRKGKIVSIPVKLRSRLTRKMPSIHKPKGKGVKKTHP